ncbi:hypothetical protein ONZ51_g2566 [Trametes cubensis]|uniref:RING-type E3 ubiquitin transferase n=1 Tax=Trametes cubensis TaxID=1111947 RepID=A0AAD7U1Z5_9APHY|nr:hypothetical protein ONZ51_g2566 [Trametes cubensis]
MDANNEEPRDLENGTDRNPPRQSASIPSFLFITFALFLLTHGHGEDASLIRYQYTNGLHSLNHQLSNYSAWLNGTSSNFSLPVEDPNTMPLVQAFLGFGPELDPNQGSYYSNITGFWHGDLHFHNLTSLNASEAASPWRHLSEQFILPTNLSAVPELLGPWNWTRSNKLAVSVGDKLIPLERDGATHKNIAIIHGRLDLSDPESSDELRLDFEGIHVLSTGTIYAMAESGGRSMDMRHLPALVPERFRNDSAYAVESELKARIDKLKEKIDSGSFDQDPLEADDSPTTKCSFRFYAQLNATTIPKQSMDELEKEIDEPTGVTTVRAPEMALEGVLLSQSCGMLYEVKHTIGVQQAAHSNTAIGLSRVSRYTFLIQSLIDAISFIGHVTLGILAEGRSSLSALAPAGLACLLFVYEAQMAIYIGQIQAPEDAPAPAEPPRPPAAATNASQTPPDGNESVQAEGEQQNPNPAPPTPPAPTRPTNLQFLWTHIRTDPAARLWTLMSISLIVVFRIVMALSLPLFFISSLYSCIWLMQIYRSARRTRSSGLSAEYMLGTTLGRLFFVFYFLGCPKNILDVEPRRWIYVVGLFMFAQVFVILLQERLGPAFFLPKRFTRTQSYNYHPPMPLPDPEAPDQSLGDCAICMDAILVDPSLRRRSKSSESKERPVIGRAGGILEKVGGVKKTYSLAPCHHLFHTECLERWLAIKNICPQCRRPLPPL